MRTHRSSRHAFTLIELLVVISIIALLIGILLPAIGKARDSAKVTISMSNLRNYGAGLHTYSADWNGRGFTLVPDDMTMITGGSYSNVYGTGGNLAQIPSVPFGFDRYGTAWSTREHGHMVPMWRPQNCSQGSFRYYMSRPFNFYFNDKYYDAMFWAPKDYTIEERIFQWMEDPGQWPPCPPTFNLNACYTYSSTYAHSIAAMVSPDCYRGVSDGGSQAAKSLPAGHRAPGPGQALYPDLKTHVLEHYWLQKNPSEAIPGTAGVPWFFNMGQDSTPATLFYDSHVRMMSVREALLSTQRVESQGEDPLDASDPACFGNSGYFEWYSYGGQPVNSYHVFTRDGIRGRDTTGTP